MYDLDDVVYSSFLQRISLMADEAFAQRSRRCHFEIKAEQVHGFPQINCIIADVTEQKLEKKRTYTQRRHRTKSSDNNSPSISHASSVAQSPLKPTAKADPPTVSSCVLLPRSGFP